MRIAEAKASLAIFCSTPLGEILKAFQTILSTLVEGKTSAEHCWGVVQAVVKDCEEGRPPSFSHLVESKKQAEGLRIIEQSVKMNIDSLLLKAEEFEKEVRKYIMVIDQSDLGKDCCDTLDHLYERGKFLPMDSELRTKLQTFVDLCLLLQRCRDFEREENTSFESYVSLNEALALQTQAKSALKEHHDISAVSAVIPPFLLQVWRKECSLALKNKGTADACHQLLQDGTQLVGAADTAEWSSLTDEIAHVSEAQKKLETLLSRVLDAVVVMNTYHEDPNVDSQLQYEGSPFLAQKSILFFQRTNEKWEALMRTEEYSALLSDYKSFSKRLKLSVDPALKVQGELTEGLMSTLLPTAVGKLTSINDALARAREGNVEKSNTQRILHFVCTLEELKSMAAEISLASSFQPTFLLLKDLQCAFQALITAAELWEQHAANLLPSRFLRKASRPDVVSIPVTDLKAELEKEICQVIRTSSGEIILSIVQEAEKLEVDTRNILIPSPDVRMQRSFRVDQPVSPEEELARDSNLFNEITEVYHLKQR